MQSSTYVNMKVEKLRVNFSVGYQDFTVLWVQTISKVGFCLERVSWRESELKTTSILHRCLWFSSGINTNSLRTAPEIPFVSICEVRGGSLQVYPLHLTAVAHGNAAGAVGPSVWNSIGMMHDRKKRAFFLTSIQQSSLMRSDHYNMIGLSCVCRCWEQCSRRIRSPSELLPAGEIRHSWCDSR